MITVLLTSSPFDEPVVSDPAAFAMILAELRERTGADFSRYRFPTVARRVWNRMMSAGVTEPRDYLALLRTNGDEAQQLLSRITIKVSRLYRNAATFDALRDSVLPALAHARGGAPLRIWSAGCGCGEEPYSLAMLLLETGIDGVIEATDIDAQALDCAAQACYGEAALQELPHSMRERYLTPFDQSWQVHEDVRRRVRFARHDLLGGPLPGAGRFDLICCRNVLIYFDAVSQRAAFRVLHGALADGGHLCLGEAEWPAASLKDAFAAVSHQTHIFRSIAAHAELPA